MNLNIDAWGEFKIADLFPALQTGKANQGMLSDGGDCFYIGAKKGDNGVMLHCAYDEDLVQKGNCIIFICNGQGSVGYANYMDRPFIGTTDIVAGYNDKLNEYSGLFIATILCQERPKYSFGRKWKTHLKETIVKLPQTGDGLPDWAFMEEYVKSLNRRPISTKNSRLGLQALRTETWKPFKVNELFEVKYGINMELNTCIEAETDDIDAVNFVARTESNNGVSARVKVVDGKIPQPAGLITCAGGGSVLSTFLQEEPFYSGRDLYLLIPLYPMSKLAKLFCITVLKANKYRYSYGRQANITLPYLELMLPVNADGAPDFDFMESYMKSLPYGDRI